jgi:hypothetical protein
MSDDMEEHKCQDLDQKVQAFLESLDTIPWFENAGKAVGEGTVTQVSSWAEAWECLQDDAWADGPFHDHVNQQHPAWTEAYDRALSAVIASGRNYELEKDIPVGLQAAYDAAGAAYEIAVGQKDGFFTKLMVWYRLGHWPCGWKGDYAEGKLIVL